MNTLELEEEKVETTSKKNRKHFRQRSRIKNFTCRKSKNHFRVSRWCHHAYL